ncbi:type IV secretory system conjugative DNA transfer family protein [Nocardioides immobilis]|uniref:type IV secretory system conjugative DNA transfer family protein n=1 Tax=Nocardioides immobilis TaxID=2049295 RepID=UPI0011C37A0D|nr:DUF87 domain-containing protein [Nocardioides immobilis]
MAVQQVDGRLIIAHRLVSMRTVDDADPDEIRRDLVAVVTALEGHTDCSFTVQWMCDPRPNDPQDGVIDVAVLTAFNGGSLPDRIDEVADDVVDLLNGPPGVWRFEVVEDELALAVLLDPIVPTHLAGIVRREAPLRPDLQSATLGFGASGTRRPQPRPDLWSMWTLGPPSQDTHRMSAALLAQEAPVCVRMTIAPTDLTTQEVELLEDLVSRQGAASERQLSVQASLHTLETMLYLRPLFEASCVVASPDPLSASLLSMIGHTLSEPTPHHEPRGVLAGGYTVVRQTQRAALRAAYTDLGTTSVGGGLAAPGLERLRHLLGAWEAANLFRLPVAGSDGAPGHHLDDRPKLRGILQALPSDGAQIGSLAGRDRPVAIDHTDRLRHTYVVGQTGTGKSTLLLNLASADIDAGHGVCVIDPHGDLVEDLLRRIPSNRIDDVVLIDPADAVAVPGVNLIEAETEAQKRYLVSETANMMYALFDPTRQGIVGPRFESMMRNCMLLLEHVRDIPGSFLDVATVFSDPAVREFLTRRISDPQLAEFWLGEFPASQRSNEAGEVIAWFRSKFEVFRTSPALRAVIGQARSTISFSDVLEKKQILLVNLSKGSLGEYDSRLLGHVIVMKLWAAVLERTNRAAEDREPFFLYIDEFQNVTTDSLATMLAEGRKYGVGLTLANQFFDQLAVNTRNALLGNVGTKLALRLGPHDAPAFAQWLGAQVEPDELSRLPNHHLVAALSPGGIPTAPVLIETCGPCARSATSADDVRSASRARWGRPVGQITDEFVERWAAVPNSFAAKAKAHRDHRTVEEPRASAPSEPSFLSSWKAKRSEGADDV